MCTFESKTFWKIYVFINYIVAFALSWSLLFFPFLGCTHTHSHKQCISFRSSETYTYTQILYVQFLARVFLLLHVHSAEHMNEHIVHKCIHIYRVGNSGIKLRRRFVCIETFTVCIGKHTESESEKDESLWKRNIMKKQWCDRVYDWLNSKMSMFMHSVECLVFALNIYIYTIYSYWYVRIRCSVVYIKYIFLTLEKYDEK